LILLRFKQLIHLSLSLALSTAVVSCGPTRPIEHSEGHISEVTEKQSDIPATVAQTTLLPPPEFRPKLETYTVVVSGVSAKDLLFSMARDAKINLDIHDDIEGTVTLNAIDQTLEQILDRIAQQVAIRYSLEDNTLRVRADKPYLSTYKVDYVNISRESKGVVRVATNIGSTGQGDIGDAQGGNNSENNSSLTEVTIESNNTFWSTLSGNINKILNTNTASAQTTDGKQDNNSDVIVNREAGLIVVRATYKKHMEVQKFIDHVLSNSKRQVMIEATIAEIKLSDSYQTGVDWTMVSNNSDSSLNILSNFTGNNLASSPFSSLTLSNTSGGDNVSVALRALEVFGDVTVLSSPKVMAINNQPAILKVVDNLVYFEMQVDTAVSDTTSLTTFETEIKTVPVGFVMAVTPYINEHNVVTLNIRPTISRVIDSIEDPNPAFKNANVISSVPVIQVREIESILTINSGDTAVIGGLMQDTVNDKSSGVPFLSTVPLLGNLFKYEEDKREKSELIIFIRPMVINHASLTNDLSEFQKYLPKPPSDNTQKKSSN